MQEKPEIDLDNLSEELYVKQSEAARIMAKVKGKSISRQYVGRLLRHPVHSLKIKVVDRKVNLHDILNLETLKPGRPRKTVED